MVTADVLGRVFTLDPNAPARVSARQFPIPGRLKRAEVSRDASTLATLGIDESARSGTSRPGRQTLNIARATPADVVRLSPDGHWLTAAGGNDQGPPSLRVWNTTTGHESRVSLPASPVAWTLSPDRHTLAFLRSSSGLPLFGIWPPDRANAPSPVTLARYRSPGVRR